MDKKSALKTYQISDTFMLRLPLLPVSTLTRISGIDSLSKLLREQYTLDTIAEALFLASPELYKLTMAWTRDGEGIKNEEKLMYTLLKYLIRMSSRSTPFGLFAGILSGNFGNQTSVSLRPVKDHQLVIRPDMQFLCSVAALIMADSAIREKLTFSPNTSLTRIGNEYRYIEYRTDDDGLRQYDLQSVKHCVELESILEGAGTGATIQELLGVIDDMEINHEDIMEYIHLLIDNQVLVSNLEPGVTGDGYYADLKRFLNAENGHNQHVQLFGRVSGILQNIHSLKGGARIACFCNITDEIRSSGIPFTENALIQADLRIAGDSCTLKESIKSDLKEFIPVLLKMSRPAHNPLMRSFKEKFLRRYDDREIPLALALDVEAGMGYLPDDHKADASALLKGLQLPPKEIQDHELQWTRLDTMLHRKWQQAVFCGHDCIEIRDEDLKNLPEPAQNFPMSFPVMARIMGKWKKDQDKHLILIKSAGGSSAINLAGRFCYLDEGIEKTMAAMADLEQSFAGESLLAEIVHLPQQRTGNILLRPVLRAYEIPYLAKAAVNDENCLPISDLLVSVRNDRVALRSRKMNKYIIPRLSNAHNYAMGSLPVYRFLCDLQTQNIRTMLGFSWGPLESETIFLPRISYKNFILQPATWNLDQEDLSGISKAINQAKLRQAVEALRKNYKIPREVVMTIADNELWLDLESMPCISLFKQEIKNKQKITLHEFLHEPDDSICMAADGARLNEFVFFMYQDR